MTSTQPTVIYREVQAYKPAWMWVGMGGAIALGGWMFWAQIISGRPLGANPAPDWVVWIGSIALVVVVPAMICSARLTVEVTQRGLTWRFSPVFMRGTIRADHIRSIEARTLHPILAFGGWGLRWRPGFGWAITISGNQGVQLHTTRRKIIIGSRHPEDLAAAIRQVAPQADEGA